MHRVGEFIELLCGSKRRHLSSEGTFYARAGMVPRFIGASEGENGVSFAAGETERAPERDSAESLRSVWMMTKFFILFLFLSIATPLFAATQNDAIKDFYAGNSFYEKSEYDKAISEYEKAVDSGIVSGPLYFNLGNAYFKQGHIGKAILNYERAKRFIPRDHDLRANYDYATRLVKYSDGLHQARFTINELCLIAATIFLLLVIFLLLRRFYLFTILLLTFCFVVSVAMRKTNSIGKEAVIVKEVSAVYFEPRKEATVYYNLYEGMKVGIVEVEDAWCKVKRPDGKMGWVERGAIETI